MGMPAAKMEPEPRLRTRAKVRPKAQLTLPEEIRQALHIGEGDEVEFAVHADGTATIRGYVSLPTVGIIIHRLNGWLESGKPTWTSRPGAARSTSPLRTCSIIFKFAPFGSADE